MSWLAVASDYWFNKLSREIVPTWKWLIAEQASYAPGLLMSSSVHVWASNLFVKPLSGNSDNEP